MMRRVCFDEINVDVDDLNVLTSALASFMEATPPANDNFNTG